jgi:hypothetical protein
MRRQFEKNSSASGPLNSIPRFATPFFEARNIRSSSRHRLYLQRSGRPGLRREVPFCARRFLKSILPPSIQPLDLKSVWTDYWTPQIPPSSCLLRSVYRRSPLLEASCIFDARRRMRLTSWLHVAMLQRHTIRYKLRGIRNLVLHIRASEDGVP